MFDSRPKDLSEVRSQDHVAETLKRMVNAANLRMLSSQTSNSPLTRRKRICCCMVHQEQEKLLQSSLWLVSSTVRNCFPQGYWSSMLPMNEVRWWMMNVRAGTDGNRLGRDPRTSKDVCPTIIDQCTIFQGVPSTISMPTIQDHYPRRGRLPYTRRTVSAEKDYGNI